MPPLAPAVGVYPLIDDAFGPRPPSRSRSLLISSTIMLYIKKRSLLVVLVASILQRLQAASNVCPASHPFICRSADDVNIINCPTCVPEYFQGPCCDKNADCVCDSYCGDDCNDGAIPIPDVYVNGYASECADTCMPRRASDPRLED